MSWLAAAAAWWLGGAACAWLLRGARRLAVPPALFTTVAGALCLAAAAFETRFGEAFVWTAAIAGPFGPPALRLDPLAAVFLAPIALLGALAAVYAPAYARLGHDGEEMARLPGHLATLQTLLAAMALVVVAANTVLLLAAWEVVTLSSWQLLSSGHRDPEVRAAGLRYLIAGHVSAGALALLFVLLAQASGGWSVPAAATLGAGTAATLGAGGGVGGLAGMPAAPLAAAPVTALFLLALIGFGTKAAVPPLHVWLPDAHASAPSHVSALLSGVLVTLGFYGLARFLPAWGAPPPAWGLTLIALGAAGACLGVVMALTQSDVKRVLAYSTVENAGLITLAMGVALLATSAGQPLVATLAWTAALLHVWNHALSKGLLFLAGGGLARVVGSRDLERWGGLLRRQPILGVGVIVGAASLVGLPGTHGFASEWLLFISLLHGSQALPGALRLGALVAVIAAAFAAGMAVACFVRLVGIGLLGHPRSAEAAAADRPAGAGWTAPLLLLAAGSYVLVLALPAMVEALLRAVAPLVPGVPLESVRHLTAPLPWLALLPAAAAVAALAYRAWLRRARPVRRGLVWDCGYARPAATMEYTASSLPGPVTTLFQPALRAAVRWTPPRGLWPFEPMAFESKTPERALVEFYGPTFRRVAALLGFFRRLQEGRVMVYLRYVGVALLVLLAWLFWPVEMPR